MEEINSKLLEKYQKLKKRRVFEHEEWISGENERLKSYQKETEKLVDFLKRENSKLHSQMLLKDDEHAKCENFLMEEKEKTKQLSEEVERLNNLLLERSQERSNFSRENGSNHRNQYTSEDQDNRTPFNLSKKIMVANSRQAFSVSPETLKACVHTDDDDSQNEESDTALDNQEQIVPDCCKGYFAMSGDAQNYPPSCIYQTLVESLFGAKFSANRQNDQSYILAVHETTGYTFSLTWLKSVDREGGDWFYHVASLGTLEHVASEWMREDIQFSSAMCPIFFERLSQIVGRGH